MTEFYGRSTPSPSPLWKKSSPPAQTKTLHPTTTTPTPLRLILFHPATLRVPDYTAGLSVPRAPPRSATMPAWANFRSQLEWHASGAALGLCHFMSLPPRASVLSTHEPPPPTERRGTEKHPAFQRATSIAPPAPSFKKIGNSNYREKSAQ